MPPEVMLQEFVTGWVSWIAACAFWLWFASRGARGERRSEMDRVDFALEVFVLSMSLSLGGVLLLVVSHEAIAESGGDSPFAVHPLAVLGALVALYLGVIAVPRWGDRLSKPRDRDD